MMLRGDLCVYLVYTMSLYGNFTEDEIKVRVAKIPLRRNGRLMGLNMRVTRKHISYDCGAANSNSVDIMLKSCIPD